MEHANATLYRDLMSKMTSGDHAGVAELMSPDIRWHEAGNPEVIEGPEAVRERFAGVEAIDGDVEVHDVLANDEHVVAMLRVALRDPSGQQVEYPVVEVAHVSDGRITERWSFMDACPQDVTRFFATLNG